MLQLVVILALLGTNLANTPFPEFQDHFAEHSQLVEPQLKEFRVENNEVRLELIHTMVTRTANLTLDMRQLTWDTWEYIENHEDTDEECLAYLRYDFDYYVWIGELDIMYMAMDMDFYMRYDADNRFNPRAFFMSRENSRAIYQTVQTLGRNRFVDSITDTVYELQDELDYYRNLWESYQVVLRDELEAMDEFAELVELELDWWYNYAMDWHRAFMGWIVEDIEYYCEMRRLTNESWSRIEKHELMQNEECRYIMRYLRDYYVWIGELDIMRCAYDMNYYMWHDSVYRFVPRAQFVKRENSRAIHQTMQTLGRNNFVDNRERVVCELEDELVYHENLWSSYRTVLCVEIEFIKPLKMLVQGQMAAWNEYAIYWHSLFMGLLEVSVEDYCRNGSWW
ncbi:hypothetical protein quinque_012761 [Culex quinquefasciatus]